MNTFRPINFWGVQKMAISIFALKEIAGPLPTLITLILYLTSNWI